MSKGGRIVLKTWQCDSALTTHFFLISLKPSLNCFEEKAAGAVVAVVVV